MRDLRRTRSVLAGLAVAGSILLAITPARSISPLPLRCDVTGWVGYPYSDEVADQFIKATGQCTGDLDGPYAVTANGFGGGCAQLITTSGTIEPCLASGKSVTLTLVSEKTGRIQTVRQIWEGYPSPYTPNNLFHVRWRGGGVIGAGYDTRGDKRWCGPSSCRYDYSATWVFLT